MTKAADGWFLVAEKARRGPMGLEQLVAELCAFEAPSGVLVWHQDLPGWTAAGQIAELAWRLPPPIPPEPAAVARLEPPPSSTNRAPGPADPEPDHGSPLQTGDPRRGPESPPPADSQPPGVSWRRVIALVYFVVGTLFLLGIGEEPGPRWPELDPMADLRSSLLWTALVVSALRVYGVRRSILIAGLVQVAFWIQIGFWAWPNRKAETLLPANALESATVNPPPTPTPPDTPTIREPLLGAERGDAVAQNNLGWAYEHGEDIEKNATEAAPLEDRLALVEERAQRAGADDQCQLGFCYYRGGFCSVALEEFERDIKKAVKWWRVAANAGHRDAQAALGWAYYSGEGVEKDLNAAFRWYKLAGDNGHVVAQRAVGSAYENGVGVQRDLGMATSWYRRAAAGGDAEAAASLRRLNIAE